MKELKEILSDWRTTAALLGIFAAALAGATLIEAKMGTAAARSVIYAAWWMYVLYALMILNFIFISMRMRLFRRGMWGVLLLHYGFVVIIAGAFITHVWSFDGKMHIREGETSDTIYFENGTSRTVPMSLQLNKFTIVRYPGSNTPASFESDVTICHNGESADRKIFMNNIARVAGYRIYQSSYDKDEMGTILTVNYDPAGTAVTYAGYFMLMAGMLIALCGRNSRLRKLYSELGAGSER